MFRECHVLYSIVLCVMCYNLTKVNERRTEQIKLKQKQFKTRKMNIVACNSIRMTIQTCNVFLSNGMSFIFIMVNVRLFHIPTFIFIPLHPFNYIFQSVCQQRRFLCNVRFLVSMLHCRSIKKATKKSYEFFTRKNKKEI